MAKRQQADDLKKLQEISYTPTSNFQDDDDAQEGNTEFSMEGVANVGSELERMTLQEKNKSMADRLQVGVWRRLIGDKIEFTRKIFCIKSNLAKCLYMY